MAPKGSKSSKNPLAFTPLPVTIIVTLTYIALFIGLLIVHLVVPTAPSSTPKGTNLTEAWADLQQLTAAYHPYNSKNNDNVRNWLLARIDAILKENKVEEGDPSGNPAVYVFNDLESNLTSSSVGVKGTSGRVREPGVSVYFEGTNIITYIRGSEDSQEEWWKNNTIPTGKGGVLVNAHYDSVSTGFGATDDGVGVVTVLQLIKYFTTPGNAPKRGLVALLNNGEEDFLNGARVYSQHPISKFAHTFLNLEGAGAGGRATLFRSTDTEVTRFYRRSKYPFGTVLSGDGFERGLIRSQTDYVIFNGILGLRGLDVAFMEPRARYHTSQDDTRHTGKNSVWHMLSAALATTQGLTSYTGSEFDGEVESKHKVPSGQGTYGVWFDLFGRVFAVFTLHSLFVLSVTLLVVCPIILLATTVLLSKMDRMYLFSGSTHRHSHEGDETISLYGWRGFFRYPIIFIIASAAPVALAYLMVKINPYIAHSSEYAVWTMMLSSWVFVAWFLSRAADWIRPTVFHRAYGFMWMFIGGWIIMVFITVAENGLHIAGGYFVVLYFAGVFLATWISYLEMFTLPRKASFSEETTDEPSRRPSASSAQPSTAAESEEPAAKKPPNEEGNEEEATESTSLLGAARRTTFANYASGNEDEADQEELPKSRKQFGDEQPWSGTMIKWTWILQFLLLAPIVIVLVGQLGLLLTSALHQTGTDGSSMFLVYISIAIFSILILAPIGPFLHRFTYHIPLFLLLALIGTLIYNLVADPFSPANRLKLYFIQEVNLESGINQVSLAGIGDGGFLRSAIATIPSAAGQEIKCSSTSEGKAGLIKCSWPGLPPKVASNPYSNIPPESQYSSWITFNTSRIAGTNTARFTILGRNTRNCKIQFSSPISSFTVGGAAPVDKRFPPVPDEGSKEIRLWSRKWGRAWTVEVKWEAGEGKKVGEDGMDGSVVCLWNDGDMAGTVPALDEIRHFKPDWVAITKMGDGLVEGKKVFMV
jgi:Peptidase family M28